MNKEQKIAITVSSLTLVLFCVNFYTVAMLNTTYDVEFKVFEANHLEEHSGTQILTWGVGKFFFLGNWTGQFYEGHTYRVTYVRQSFSKAIAFENKAILIVLEWEEVV